MNLDSDWKKEQGVRGKDLRKTDPTGKKPLRLLTNPEALAFNPKEPENQNSIQGTESEKDKLKSESRSRVPEDALPFIPQSEIRNRQSDSQLITPLIWNAFAPRSKEEDPDESNWSPAAPYVFLTEDERNSD